MALENTYDRIAPCYTVALEHLGNLAYLRGYAMTILPRKTSQAHNCQHGQTQFGEIYLDTIAGNNARFLQFAHTVGYSR